jgi:signal peptidase I
LPGLGQAYQRQWAFAALFFVTFLGAIALSVAVPILAILATAISYLCLYHAYISSPSRRHKSRQLILVICGLLLVSDLISGTVSSLAEASYIPSGAMEPTLQIGDRLIVDKTRYLFSEPARGDVVLFWAPDVMSIPDILLPPDDRREAFIKRIIGLPGETVEVKAGQVLIDGTPLQEDYILAPPTYEWGPETIPDNAYFVLGDNRNNSFDSHIWGTVPAENIIGQANKRFWPPERNGLIQ